MSPELVELLLLTVGLVAVVALHVSLQQLSNVTKGTTLEAARSWAMLSCAGLYVTVVAQSQYFVLPTGVRSGLTCLSCALLLTAPVAVLGARKPGGRAWQWFVVLPLVCVLLWPAVSQLVSSRGEASVELGTPQVCGFVLVLVMSSGPYLGTSLQPCALLCSLAILLLLAGPAGWLTAEPWIVVVSCVLLAIAGRVAVRTINFRSQRLTLMSLRSERLDAVWQLFQDLYGFAWSRRVQDRVNQFASRESWKVELTPAGFRSRTTDPGDATSAVNSDDLQTPEAAFTWVLTRFVDEQWLTSRLSEPAS